MGWEKTHDRGACPKPTFAAIFMRAGAIWKCDDCGVRWRVTKTRGEDNVVETGWRRL